MRAQQYPPMVMQRGRAVERVLSGFDCNRPRKLCVKKDRERSLCRAGRKAGPALLFYTPLGLAFPLRHSPLTLPVTPPPHAWEAIRNGFKMGPAFIPNIWGKDRAFWRAYSKSLHYRLPRVRGHEQQPRPADETGSCEWRSAPIFASGHRPAPQKPAKRKRSCQRS